MTKNEIRRYKKGKKSHIWVKDFADEPLHRELVAFVNAINKKKKGYPDASVGHKIVAVATMNNKEKTDARKKVAIIGAGIFGTNCAIELAKNYDVTLFEKNKDILSEASFVNQYRHHWGYHYPRSQSTVNDIKDSMESFENLYESAIVRKFPTYYSIAKNGSKVTAEEYIQFCKQNNLPYTLEYPDESYLDRSKVSICLKTFEPIYDFKILKKKVSGYIKKNKVKLRLNSKVISAKITKEGQKMLMIKNSKSVSSENFDYLINITYARHNEFCKWLGFPVKPIRLDLVEALWMRINLPKISLAVMDGPFTNMVPTSKKGIFTLVHIKESMLKRFVPKDGLVPRNIFTSGKITNVKKIIKKSAEWLPIINKAKHIATHHVLRGVNAYTEHDDARPSDITNHGFGCWSVLGGKIINSVSLAKKIAQNL